MTTNSITGTSSSTDVAAAAPKDQLASKEAFLQLLVSQIKNQNPLDPTDGVQFLTQLAQFSQLEQMLGMRSDLGQIRDALTAAPAETEL
jgi:flagellar basal-body rod modification protein FlgD